MDGDPHILEQSLTARERALQEMFVRLEKKLEGYQSQIDVVDNQREQLEERVINMEEFFELKDEAVDKEIAEERLEEKLKSMTQQAEKYKNLFIAERNNNRHRIEALEAMMSTMKAEMATRKQFDGFSNEMLSTHKESFHTQLKIVSDKLTEAQNELIRQPRETNQSKLLVSQVQALPDNSLMNETAIKKTTPKENLVAEAFKTEKDNFATATKHASVLQSEEPEIFQELKEEPTPATAAKVTVLTSSQIFTIGRGDSSENEDDMIYLSPRETSAAPNKLSTAFPRDTIFSALPQGTNISSKFTFSMRPPHESALQKLKPSLPPTTSLSPKSSSHTEPYFNPVIPLPNKIQVVTGEEGLDVLFSERAKLYRFDADSGQWKERGVGDVKLLRHPKTGQGRVLMRREHIKNLCANHNINVGMKLKPNVGSDRSWVWYTTADYAEGEARPEKLAIKLKSVEIAGKFKEVFEDLKETLSSDIRPETEEAEDQQRGGCTIYEQFLSRFAAGSDAWTCKVCLYVQNKAENSKCVVCNSGKPAVGSAELLSETATDTPTSTSASVVESVEPNPFQDFTKDWTPVTSVFQSTSVRGSRSSQLFTIGRGDSNEDILDDETSLSPSKTSSPSKSGVTPQKLPTPFSQESVSTNLNLPFGTNAPAKFTFSLQVSPTSPLRKPKSPLSPGSPLFPESPGHTEDDGPYFEPLIPLPEKVKCRTGEDGQEVLFCDRCKLFRFDSDASQWKERGIGDIKILLNPSSGKYQILMRRELVLKLCANHIISADMELKPFPDSDRAWLWRTLADFSEEVAAAETLGARFRTNEIATQFKDTFDRALKSLTPKEGNVGSSVQLEGKQTYQGTKNSLKESSSLDICPLQKQSAIKLKKAAWSPPGKPVKGHDDDKLYFEPVMPLPDEIQFVTGEEGLDVLFSERAKLYRFDADSGQWKERGVGDVKLLRYPKTGQGRVLMRREHIKKLCANHNINAGMELKPIVGSDRSWVWYTPADYAEGEARPEKLAIKLKSVEIAGKFKEVFDELKKSFSSSPVPPIHCFQIEAQNKKNDSSLSTKEDNDAATSLPTNCNGGSLFTPESPSNGSKRQYEDCLLVYEVRTSVADREKASRLWLPPNFFNYLKFEVCSGCLGCHGKAQMSHKYHKVSDVVTATFTEVSNNVKETTEPEEDQKDAVSGVYKPLISTLTTASEAWTCEVCYIENNVFSSKCIACNSMKAFDGCQEPFSKIPIRNMESLATTKNVSVVGQEGANAFPDLKKDSTPVASSVVRLPGVEGLAHLQLFTSRKHGVTPQKLFSIQNEDHDDSATGHFEPLISRPDLIDMKTVEEDEEVMFSNRAKLYRFVAEDKQWKERGCGDIKLLRNRQSGKMRVLMRRDQVLKICANHQITTDMKLQPNAGSEKSWVWSTLADFSEQECKAEQLAVRFKSEDIAKQFKEKFEDCQEMLRNQSPAKPIQDEKKQEEVKEDLFAKFKAAEGSWECDICMVRNDSEKFDCVACGNLKPGAEPLQGQSKDMKPLFSFGTAASSTRSGFSFGTTASSGFTFGSAISSTGTGSLFESSALSTNSGNSLGSVGTPMRRIKRSVRRCRR